MQIAEFQTFSYCYIFLDVKIFSCFSYHSLRCYIMNNYQHLANVGTVISHCLRTLQRGPEEITLRWLHRTITTFEGK